MKSYFQNQYDAALGMFREVAAKYSDDIWVKRYGGRWSAWQMAYHTLFFTNLYAAPSEDDVVQWREHLPRLYMTSEIFADEHVLTRENIIEYADLIIKNIPTYLDSFSPDADCWAHWYNLSQFEFHLNNLRHIHHHMGQLIERHQLVEPLTVNWETPNPIADIIPVKKLRDVFCS